MLEYSEYLKQSFSLDESILVPFLTNLKNHLEEFQVFLGKVESWLMGSSCSTIFIQDTFSVAVEVLEKKHSIATCCIHCGEIAHYYKRKKHEQWYVTGVQGADFDGHIRKACFVRKCLTVLETIASSDDFELVFDVSSINGQKRLEKFCAFSNHPASFM